VSENIVLVTVDSLRADKCGFLNEESSLTPNLDSLAEDGLAFENAISPGPRTPDTLPALFTGRYPVVGSETTIGSEQSVIRGHLQRYETIAEALSRQGYETAAFTPNPYTSRYFGYERGFDHFRDFIDEDRSSAVFKRILGGGSTPAVAVRLLMSALQRENVFRSWDSYFEDIETWIDQASEPYFLWVFLMDCHIPYLASRSNRTQGLFDMLYGNVRWYWNDKSKRFGSRDHDRLLRAYDDSIRHVDEFVGKIDETVPDARLVVTADHGESFFEHGRYGHPPDWLYEENVHVPLVVSDGETQGAVDRPISIDKTGRLLHPAGISDPLPTTDIAYAQSLTGKRIAARGETWKYIASVKENSIVDGELYDLATDEGETTDVSDERESLAELGRAAVCQRLGHHDERAAIRSGTKSFS
jgi:arylsulfatase